MNGLTKKQLQAKVKSLEAKVAKDDSNFSDEVAAYVSAAIAEIEKPSENAKADKHVTFSTVNDDRDKTFKVASQMVQKILKRKRGEDD